MDMEIENEVINQIKNSKTKMRPRWYFILRAVFMIVVAVVVFFLVLFFVSFMIFALRADGGLLAANYGLSGWNVFFHALPLSLLLLSLALILVLALLLKRYAFIYHQPFLYLLLALIAVVGLGSVFIAATSLHSGIFNYASRNGLPLVEGIYQFEMTPAPGGIYRGEVVGLLPNGFILEATNGSTSTVLIASGTPADNLKVGDYVIIFGHPASATATIEVFGMQQMNNY